MAIGGCIVPEEGSPSFFKVIRNPSAPHLSLPKAFVRRYFEKIAKNLKLVTATGEHSWSLEFVKIGEDYCFAHGWEKVVEDVQLCIRDIVVFWLIDPLTFLVSFLGNNGCEKDLPLIKTNDDGQDGDHVNDDGKDEDVVGQCHDNEVMPDKNLFFEKVFSKKTFRYYLPLPMKFVKAAGLENKQNLKLKDHEGKEWNMRIMAERHSSVKYMLKGWVTFCKHHRLSDGDVCMFTFNKKEDVLNVTQMIRCKTPIKQEISMEEVNRHVDGDGNVKIEDDWLPAETPHGGSGSGGGVKVKIEYDLGPEEVVKRKRGRPRSQSCANVNVEKPRRDGGVEEKTKTVMEKVFRTKHVVYF